MSREHVELLAAAVVAVVVLIAVALIAMSILSNADEPEPRETPGFTIPVEITGRADGSDWCSTYARAQEAFNWPHRSGWSGYRAKSEPIRENFRSWLEGGPDYRG